MHHKARKMLISQRTQLNSALRGRLAEIGSSRRRGSKTPANWRGHQGGRRRDDSGLRAPGPRPAQRLIQSRSARRNTTRMKTCLPQIENHLNMMKNRNNRAAAALPLMWTELALASWETIARRSLLMMSGACSPDEYHRMAAEKLRALSRSTRVFASGRTGATAVAAAMRPWHGPATANAKRLRRK
jgi:hypothetical protein